MLSGKPLLRYPQPSLEQKLAETQHAFEEFTYIVAHDLGAPLRSITNFSQLLEAKYGSALDEKALHYVDLITENSHKAQARLAGLLQYSRLNTTPLKFEPIESRACIDHCLRHLKLEIEKSEARIQVGPLPQVRADNERLTLLFHCLLHNALTFCKRRPEIDIRADRGHEAWVFAVRDNGIGIATKDHEVIFNVFHRLQKDAEFPGAGIGLALAQKIAAQHGGLIWVESSIGDGATFYFTLPDALIRDSLA